MAPEESRSTARSSRTRTSSTNTLAPGSFRWRTLVRTRTVRSFSCAPSRLRGWTGSTWSLGGWLKGWTLCGRWRVLVRWTGRQHTRCGLQRVGSWTRTRTALRSRTRKLLRKKRPHGERTWRTGRVTMTSHPRRCAGSRRRTTKWRRLTRSSCRTCRSTPSAPPPPPQKKLKRKPRLSPSPCTVRAPPTKTTWLRLKPRSLSSRESHPNKIGYATLVTQNMLKFPHPPHPTAGGGIRENIEGGVIFVIDFVLIEATGTGGGRKVTSTPHGKGRRRALEEEVGRGHLNMSPSFARLPRLPRRGSPAPRGKRGEEREGHSRCLSGGRRSGGSQRKDGEWIENAVR
eukprot:Hpha_TRINITY_DN15341_c1_g6::TRINITY_DN15341_c1_g6_i1::g.90980::m.90980